MNAMLKKGKIFIQNQLFKKMNSSRGQIAIVLMLVIAAALIFYAVSLNVGKLSHTKTLVTMASNAGASKMASQMASYGQVLFMETLGGKKRVCGLTGIAAAIVSIVVTVICIIIIAASYSAGTPAAAALWMAVIGLVLAVVSLVMQITYIQPGISSMWNKIIAETMEMSDQFVENGIQSGLTTAITDTKQIPDLDDLDTDGVFGFTNDGGTQWKPADEYSRYAFYYTERLKMIEVMSASIMMDFQDALRDFVYEDVNTDWGIYDPPSCGVNCCYYGAGAPVYSYCNPCCLPDTVVDPTDTTGSPAILPIRATCCDTGAAGECGISASCTNPTLSPFLNGLAGDFPYVYDEYTENYDNTFVSFMEKLGWDDEHTDYRKDMSGMSPALGVGVVNPNYIDGIPQVDDSVVSGGLGDYRIEDTSGFMGMDGKRGIFSYLWKLVDWGTDLNDALHPRTCQWCDDRGAPTCNPMFSGLWENAALGLNPQLLLPVEPSPADPNGPQFDPTYCVDSLTANNSGVFSVGTRTFHYPPVAPDNITIPQNILADDTECAQEIYSYDGSGHAVENEMVGFWKPGINRYCNRTVSGDPTANSMTWPYYGNCPGRGTYTDPDYGYQIDCICEDSLTGVCPAGNVPNFQEDVLDDLVYGLPEFIEWANDILDYTPRRLVRDFVSWYPDAGDWIEPPSPDASSTSSPPCYTCGTAAEPHVGYLWVWKEEMDRIYERVNRWLENDGNNFNYRGTASFTSGTTDDVWCVPNDTSVVNVPQTNCLSPQERNAIEGTGFDNSSLYAVLACMDWNVRDNWSAALPSGVALPAAPTPVPTVTDVGNWAKFNACSDSSWCRNHESLCATALPRSLAPDFCTDHASVFRYADNASAALFSTCKSTLSGSPTAEPADGVASAADLASGGLVCGAITSSSCGVNQFYPANHDCQNACSVIPTGGQYVEAQLDFDAPTYQTINYTVNTCQYYTQAWVNDYGWVDHGSCVPDPAVPCPTADNPSAMCSPGTCTWVSDWKWEVIGSHLQTYWWTKNPCPYQVEKLVAANDCVTTDADGFETQVNHALDLAGGSCAEEGPDWQAGGFFDSTTYGSPVPRHDKRFIGYIEAVQDARDESVNQMEKLIYRENYMNLRVAEMQEIQDLMSEASGKFEEFLTGPAADLIQARIDYDSLEDKGLPYHAVYGWQDDPPEHAPAGSVGQWHVVRVDARSPSRCDNACSTDYSQSGNWPRVKTYGKSWGMERCYELTDTDGRVKMRVTRYDEPLFYGSGAGTDETRNKSSIFFPGGRKLWDFRADLPLGDSERPPPSANNLGLTCADAMPDDPPGLPAPYNSGGEKAGIYKGAFMLNTPYEHTDCWERVSRLLTHGVSTETCAEYYFEEGTVEGFSVRFVPCPSTPFGTTYRSP